jgi:SAM-dependent methyltransferase
MLAYYARRAAEYERIYAIPERQPDLGRLRGQIVEFGAGRRVLEVACGTGYWTEALAIAAVSVVATDAGEEVLAVARAKAFPSERVLFLRADAFGLDVVPGDFDAGLAGFWWSHLRLADVPRFLAGLHRRLGQGARVLLFDNRFVPGSSTPIARVDEAGNSYQRRTLANGESYEVIKNFPSPQDVRDQLEGGWGRAIRFTELDFFWIASYEVGSDGSPT